MVDWVLTREKSPCMPFRCHTYSAMSSRGRPTSLTIELMLSVFCGSFGRTWKCDMDTMIHWVHTPCHISFDQVSVKAADILPSSLSPKFRRENTLELNSSSISR